MDREQLVETVARVQTHWAQLQRRQEALLEAIEVRCPPDCGHCCTTPVTEASLLEMLPLAFDLIECGEAEAVLERLAAAGRPCAMYEPHASDPMKGRCTVYPLRPTMCRLYGFAARTCLESRGGKRYVPCLRHEQWQPDAVSEAQRKLEEEGLDIPMIATEHARVMMVNRELGRESLPINEALAQAISFAQAILHPPSDDSDTSDEQQGSAPSV